MDQEIFDQGMVILMAAYPDYDCKPETLQAYREFLKDFDNQDFERVVRNHISQSKFFPKICELREELVRLRGFNRSTATDAWNDLIQAAESGKEPEMNANTERALRVCGGWVGFSLMTYRDLQFHRKDFERLYNEGLERGDRQIKIGHQGEEQRRIEVIE